MSIQVKRLSLRRKRFIQTSNEIELTNWQFELGELKKFLIQQTGLQIVSDCLYFEFDSDGKRAKLKLEVIGLPAPLNSEKFDLVDIGPCQALVHEIVGHDIFNLDFESLIMSCNGLKEKLRATILQICLREEKIELLFFNQKDYIQNRANI
jgi:hypothetical protein